MIRRSTLVFLTCLSACSISAVGALSTSAESKDSEQVAGDTPVLVSQASETSSTSSLRLGERGSAVTALQSRLQSSGYYNQAVDGVYGLETERAVRAFQEDKGLAATGRLDDATWDALTQSSAEDSDIADGSEISDSETGTININESADVESTSSGSVPAASELPPLTSETSASVDTSLNAEKEGRAGRFFTTSLIIAALLASFGVGFFFANKGKQSASAALDDDWSEPGSSKIPKLRGSLPGTPLNGNANSVPDVLQASTHTAPDVSSTGRAANSRSSGNGSISARNSDGAEGTGLTVTSISAVGTGQIGDTVPMGQVDVMENLMSDLRNPDPRKRRKAIWELGQRGNSLAVQPLVDSMVTADSKEKSLVLAALSEIGIRSLKPMNRALAIALQDDNPEVRKNAIRDLSRIYELVVQISHMLGHATEDEDPEVRQTASWALEQLNRIREAQNVDSNMRTFTSNTNPPIDLLSSEASIRRSQRDMTP